jgi:hypothetical protein
MKQRRLLQAACLLLLGIALFPWWRGRIEAGRVPADPGIAAQELQDFHMPAPVEAYQDILDRPVFVATRRMAVFPAPVPRQANEILLLDRYPVVGVVVAGEQRLVLIRRAAGDTVSRIEQGADLDGWTLTEVSRARLVLEKAGERKEISLQNAE